MKKAHFKELGVCQFFVTFNKIILSYKVVELNLSLLDYWNNFYGLDFIMLIFHERV